MPKRTAEWFQPYQNIGRRRKPLGRTPAEAERWGSSEVKAPKTKTGGAYQPPEFPSSAETSMQFVKSKY